MRYHHRHQTEVHRQTEVQCQAEVQQQLQEAEVQYRRRRHGLMAAPEEYSFLTIGPITNMCEAFEEVIKGQSN